MKNYDEALQSLNPKFRRILDRIPKIGFERLPPDWLHWQILERLVVLEYTDIAEGFNVLEIGCGPQATATIALAALVGEKGRVVAIDRGRWKNFWEIINQSGLQSRVIPLQEDARKLQFPFPCFDLVACVHGIRSFDNRESIVEAIKEMLRATKERIFIAESSPIAKNKAQEAHLAMYNLRRLTFLALGQEKIGDLHYFSPQELRDIVVEAGASKIDMKVVDVNMPHHLAYFPFDTIRKIEDKAVRDDLEEKWRKALEMLDKYGEEHPSVIVLNALR